jgi:hypothetical protein
MTYTIQGGNVQTKQVKLTTADPTVIVDGGQSGATVVGIYAAEIAGATPTFTLEKYDGTTRYFIRGALAMTAYQEYTRDVIIVLKAGESLRAEASAANQIDVVASYIPGDRTAKG